MIKKIIAILLCVTILIEGCAAKKSAQQLDKSTNDSFSQDAEKITNILSDTDEVSDSSNETTESVELTIDAQIDYNQEPTEMIKTEAASEGIQVSEEDYVQKFGDLDDPELLQYIKDSVYAELESSFENEDYIIEDITTAYVSKEYLEEIAYNSKENIYFGYTLSEIDKLFDGDRYVFTLGEDGTTVVKKFQSYDDTYEKIIKNVAIGSGVILVCVTVSVVTGGAGAPAVSAVFMASAKTGEICALSSGTFGGVVAGVAEGIRSGDMDEAVKAGAYAGSEAFKWGAITGAITGGVDKALTIKKAAQTVSPIPSPKESENYAQVVYGGREQVSYYSGQEVRRFTTGATRPDVVRKIGTKLEAIEVKNYDLAAPGRQNQLCSSLLKEVSQRVDDLPPGSMQRIVLDTRGRDFSERLIEQTVTKIRQTLIDVYPDIPIDVL